MARKKNYSILKPDAKLQEACESLREHVDNINRAPVIHLAGRVYHSRDADAIQTVKHQGVEIGYRLRDFGKFMRREIFVKVPGHKLDDVNKDEKERIVTAVFNAFLIPGANLPEIGQIAPDCLLIRQDFIPLHLVEKAPGLVSIAGGMKKDVEIVVAENG